MYQQSVLFEIDQEGVWSIKENVPNSYPNFPTKRRESKIWADRPSKRKNASRGKLVFTTVLSSINLIPSSAILQ